MKRMFWKLSGVLVATSAVLVVAGCSSDDDGGTSKILAPDEQYELIEAFASPEAVSSIMIPAVRTQAGIPFWDGVDAEDIDDFLLDFDFLSSGVGFGNRSELAKLFPNGALGKAVPNGKFEIDGLILTMIRRASAEADTVTVVYDDAKGWWFISAVMGLDMDSAGTSFHLDMSVTDSVRFEDASGSHARNPDDFTDRIQQGIGLSLSADASISDEAFGNIDLDAGIDLGSSVDVRGLTGTVVTINSDMSLETSLDLGGQIPDSLGQMQNFSVDGSLDLDAQMMNVMLPKPTSPGEETCPTSGSMSADIALDLTIDTPEEQGRAKGNWEADVFISGGNVTVTVQSGDVFEQVTGPACP